MELVLECILKYFFDIVDDFFTFDLSGILIVFDEFYAFD